MVAQASQVSVCVGKVGFGFGCSREKTIRVVIDWCGFVSVVENTRSWSILVVVVFLCVELFLL
jgi:hypothetical protein